MQIQCKYNLQDGIATEKEHILAILSAGEDIAVLMELGNRKHHWKKFPGRRNKKNKTESPIVQPYETELNP